eukprot:TRINITY_DN30021_c0_g2_i1.p1 TRINITY_DN30021_c0_g2~~TRINITY_DN30021_c0_g2_i1.p1  ORF type:complete len:555 (+),score=53.83 TRINITY_DN30021_c0_g2_i1:99-1763(+)
MKRLSTSSKLVLVVPWLVAAGLWDNMPPGTISFRKLGICASGHPSFYGAINPSEMLAPDSLFIEPMGGAICFNHASCVNHNLEMWTDIDIFLKDFLFMKDDEMAVFKSGLSIPLSMMPKRQAYWPDSKEHPFYGRRGLFLVMCSADIFMGAHNATYAPDPVHFAASKSCDEALSGSGNDYRGCQNATKNGFPCMKWTSQTPHKHGSDLARNGLGDHNFCRNPDGSKHIWCYTDNEFLRWDYCVPASEKPKPITMYHHGGKNLHDLLTAAKKELPDLKDIKLYGASGGGVAASAWASVVADMWTDAKVYALVDSPFHVFPGTQLFDYFWDKAQYGQGPSAERTPHYRDIDLPDFDWRLQDALAKEIQSHEGRVKLAYISCLDDYVVYGDRTTMAVHAKLDGLMKTLLDKETQHNRTWAFLNSLHGCSPDGSIYSFVLDCPNHHQTRRDEWFTSTAPGSDVTMHEFSVNFLKGLPPNPENLTRQKYWFEDHAPTESDLCCKSSVRRRRGTSVRSGRNQDSQCEHDEVSGAQQPLICRAILFLAFLWYQWSLHTSLD